MAAHAAVPVSQQQLGDAEGERERERGRRGEEDVDRGTAERHEARGGGPRQRWPRPESSRQAEHAGGQREVQQHGRDLVGEVGLQAEPVEQDPVHHGRDQHGVAVVGCQQRRGISSAPVHQEGPVVEEEAPVPSLDQQQGRGDGRQEVGEEPGSTGVSPGERLEVPSQALTVQELCATINPVVHERRASDGDVQSSMPLAALAHGVARCAHNSPQAAPRVAFSRRCGDCCGGSARRCPGRAGGSRRRRPGPCSRGC